MLFTIEFARLFLCFQLKYLIFYDKYYLFEKIRLRPFFWVEFGLRFIDDIRMHGSILRRSD